MYKILSKWSGSERLNRYLFKSWFKRKMLKLSILCRVEARFTPKCRTRQCCISVRLRVIRSEVPGRWCPRCGLFCFILARAWSELLSCSTKRIRLGCRVANLVDICLGPCLASGLKYIRFGCWRIYLFLTGCHGESSLSYSQLVNYIDIRP